jgi:hypothetical protein
MEHHSGFWDGRVGGRSKANGNCRIARETPLIKHCMTADDDLLLNWVPELPGLDTIRVANEDALLGVRL